MKSKQFETLLYSAVGVAAMFVLLAGFNVISAALKQRIDLTREKAYTLSAGTKAILKKIDTPVKIRFYCTRAENATPETVFMRNYAQQVEDLLDEFKQYAGGKLTLQKLNPLPDSDAEDSARLDGIEGQVVSAEGEPFYLGLAVKMLDETVALPFLSPSRERMLEYDVARAISQVITPQKPVVGVMSALPAFGEFNPMMMRMGQRGQEPWIIINELKRDFAVKEVSLGVDKIDEDIKVLVVIYPREISEGAQYAIDQFILRGGKVVAFLDPLSIADNRNSNPSNPLQGAMASGATLDKLLKAWGIEFDVSKAVADMTFKTNIRGQDGRPQAAAAVLSLTKDAMNADDALTSQLDNLLLPYPGVFTGTPAAGLKETVLLKTTKNSQLIDKIMAQFGGGDKDFKASDKEYALAIRLTGKFKTAFPDGKPGEKSAEKKDEAEKKEDKKPETKPDNSLKESTTDGVVILVGDSDMIFDPVCVQVQNIFGQKIVIPQNGNLNLAQSMVEQLAGDSNLIGVRSRATLNRPFTVVKRMEEKAQESYRSKIKELETSLSETQQKVNELQRTKEKGQRFILSPEQQQELAKFRQKEAEAKKELKQVRKNLRREVDSLENRLKWINIAAMPVIVSLSGIALAVYKRKRTAAK
ncbi:MAG: hypothetical protein DME18_02260 [Verrucomicrobia bacterium]|nr:MAG: hypothetical protein DME18_02260 [Verrucomicrobiota bacterium]